MKLNTFVFYLLFIYCYIKTIVNSLQFFENIFDDSKSTIKKTKYKVYIHLFHNDKKKPNKKEVITSNILIINFLKNVQEYQGSRIYIHNS